jgi:hypothetical protein
MRVDKSFEGEHSVGEESCGANELGVGSRVKRRSEGVLCCEC